MRAGGFKQALFAEVSSGVWGACWAGARGHARGSLDRGGRPHTGAISLSQPEPRPARWGKVRLKQGQRETMLPEAKGEGGLDSADLTSLTSAAPGQACGSGDRGVSLWGFPQPRSSCSLDGTVSGKTVT